MNEVENSSQKGAPGSGMELNPVFKEKNTLGNEIKAVVTSEKDQPH